MKHNSFDQHTLFQVLSAADVLVTQVIPSELVRTRFPTPELPTTTKMSNSADQQILVQVFATGVERTAHVIPSLLVITELTEPTTAANIFNSDDQTIPFQFVTLLDCRSVHSIPSWLVITRPVPPLLATAANNRSVEDQQTLFHVLSAAEARKSNQFGVTVDLSTVVTTLDVPTTTNIHSSADQQTPVNAGSPTTDCIIQSVPFLLIMIRFPVPP